MVYIPVKEPPFEPENAAVRTERKVSTIQVLELIPGSPE